jgi:hypothetical protein
VRSQRIVRVELYPAQLCPDAGQLLWRPNLRVELSWDAPANDVALQKAAAPDSFTDALLGDALLNGETARAFRMNGRIDLNRSPSELEARCDRCATFDEPPVARYKITVNRDGIYQLTRADLEAAGLPNEPFDPRSFRLTNGGRPVAIQVSGEADGSFDSGDTLRFFGEMQRAQSVQDTIILDGTLVTTDTTISQLLTGPAAYTDENVYWLEVGGAPGPRMAEPDGTPHGAPSPSSYRALARAEEANEWWTWHFTSRDTWFWHRIQTASSATRSVSVRLSAIDPSGAPALVFGEAASRSHNPFATPDHHTRVSFNGVLVADDQWDGIARHRFSGSIPSGTLREGDNQLDFEVRAQAALPSTDMYLDWFGVTYDRRFIAEEDRLDFSYGLSGSFQFAISGLSAAADVYDISAPLSPRRLRNVVVAPVGGAYAATFQVAHNAGGRYLVAGSNGVLAPLRVERHVAKGLAAAANGADYIVIAPGELLDGARVLAAYRANRGLRTIVVDLRDVYDEFNDGIAHPIAIKRMLATAYARWQPPAPQYAVLIGDGHWNMRGYNPSVQGNPPNLMPPALAWVDPWQGEVDSSNALATIVGDDPLPDLAIGRIPVTTAAELDAVIQKIIAYESGPTEADWNRRLLFVADNVPDSAGDFVAETTAFLRDHAPQGYAVSRLNLNDVCGAPGNPPQPCPRMTTDLLAALNGSGASLVSYSGHGSVHRWAHELILSNPDVDRLANGAQLPVVLSLTCLDGYWVHPRQMALAEALLRAPGRGAVALFSPTGLGVATGHTALQRGFFNAVFTRGERTLGPATIGARLALFQAAGGSDLIATYTIFGDPALRLALPSPPAPPDPTPGPSPSPVTGPSAPANRSVYLPLVQTNE